MSEESKVATPQWLGLLKWSLAYVDGTRSSSEIEPLSAEDKAFLEKVMTDGIIDPGKRMKELLLQLTESLQRLCSCDVTKQEDEDEEPEMSIINLMVELQDIVEQIDYANDFVKINGLPFLCGCTCDNGISVTIRKQCLRILATLAQNNPPVQQAMLDYGALEKLCNLYAQIMEDDESGTFRTLLIQALSCMVRSHVVGEEIFCRVGRELIIHQAIGLTNVDSPRNVRRKMLFLVRALLTSDYSSRQRVQDFSAVIRHTIVSFLDQEEDWELREETLGLLLQILQQKHCVDEVWKERDIILNWLVPRINTLRAHPSEEYCTIEELELSESLLSELSKDLSNHNVAISASDDTPVQNSPIMMLEGTPYVASEVHLSQ